MCLLCGGKGPLTKEHVIPGWLNAALDVQGPLRLWVNDQELRQAREFDIQIRAVCAACNQGWLSSLEVAFAGLMTPALRGSPVTLAKAEQTIVAMWGLKTWLLMELALAHDRGGALRSRGALPWMYEHDEPPEQYMIRVGAVDTEGRQLVWLATNPLSMAHGAPPAGVMGVFSIGSLLFHIWAPLVAMEPPRSLVRIAIGPALAPAFKQVWPFEAEKVDWPPPRVLEDEDLDGLWPAGGRKLAGPVKDIDERYMPPGNGR